MTQVQSHSRVLEDGDTALLDAELPGEAEIVGEGEDVGEEFSSLDDLTTEASPAAAAAAAAKPGAKPAAQTAKPAAAAAASGDEADIPEEFRGKSKKELVEMYRQAHSTIGRQGTELGEMRRLADVIIRGGVAQRQQAQQPSTAAEKPKLPDDVEIFNKPTESILKIIEQSPVIQELRRTMGAAAADQQTLRTQAATERFNAAHPDATEIMRDVEFRKWVAASPIRRTLLERAHSRFDFAAGDEVFSTWKALRNVSKPQAAADAGTVADAGQGEGQPTPEQVKQAAATMARARAAKNAQATQAAAAQAAAAPTGGASAAPSKGGKKLFRRADVIRLMVEDPDRYEALSQELTQAYAEGRVR